MDEITETRTAHAGRLLRVEERTFRGAGGRRVMREIVRHPGSVVVVPARDDETIVLVRQRREPVGAWLWEFPAGTLEPDEPPQRAAARELEEETGYRAGRWRDLGAFYTSPGYCDEVMHVYEATALREGTPRPEADEVIEVRLVARKELLKMIRGGEIRDGKTIAAVLLWQGAEGADA